MAYDYSNPKRMHCEPLMRYIWTPMMLSFVMVTPLAIISAIRNDGGKWLMENYPFTEYIIYAWIVTCVPLLITYTILYVVRDWGNHEKWKMQYYWDEK